MTAPSEPGDSTSSGGLTGTPAPGSDADKAGARLGASGEDPSAMVIRSADSGEAPPWQRAASRSQPATRPAEPANRGASEPTGSTSAAAARPTEVIRAVEPTGRPADPTRAVVTSRPPERPTEVTRVVGPGILADSRTAVAHAAPAPPGPSPAPAPDTRVNRYITGTAAPAALQQPKPAEPEPARTEVARGKDTADVTSELPDLSGRSAAPRAESGSRSRIQVGPRVKGGPVRASMQIRRIDPWSALKVSALLSVAMFFVWMIAVAFLYLVLGAMGVWTKLNSNVGDLLTSNSGAGGELVSAGSIFGGALLIGLVNIVLMTAMATIGAFIYNLATDIVGGVEVTLADRD